MARLWSLAAAAAVDLNKMTSLGATSAIPVKRISTNRPYERVSGLANSRSSVSQLIAASARRLRGEIEQAEFMDVDDTPAADDDESERQPASSHIDLQGCPHTATSSGDWN